jgi:hypothetical protein
LDADLRQLLLLLFKDLEELSLVLVAKFVSFDSGNLKFFPRPRLVVKKKQNKTKIQIHIIQNDHYDIIRHDVFSFFFFP